jgi:hypothetical protein
VHAGCCQQRVDDHMLVGSGRDVGRGIACIDVAADGIEIVGVAILAGGVLAEDRAREPGPGSDDLERDSSVASGDKAHEGHEG